MRIGQRYDLYPGHLLILDRDICVLGTWNLYLEPEGGLPLFTELPRRRVFSETGLPALQIRENSR
jgi:hypothetical protein